MIRVLFALVLFIFIQSWHASPNAISNPSQGIFARLSGEGFSALSFSHPSELGAVLWLMAIKKSTDQVDLSVRDQHSVFYSLINRVLDLRPKFTQAALFGSQVLAISGDDIDGASELYERARRTLVGREANSSSTIPQFVLTGIYLNMIENQDWDKLNNLFDEFELLENYPSYYAQLKRNISTFEGRVRVFSVVLKQLSHFNENQFARQGLEEKIKAYLALQELLELNQNYQKTKTLGLSNEIRIKQTLMKKPNLKYLDPSEIYLSKMDTLAARANVLSALNKGFWRGYLYE